jgi:hypothetical protein
METVGGILQKQGNNYGGDAKLVNPAVVMANFLAYIQGVRVSENGGVTRDRGVGIVGFVVTRR